MCSRRISKITARLSKISLVAIVLAVTLFGFTPVITAQAATVTVTNTNDSGAGSLRQTISKAAAGSTIVFADNLAGGTIKLTSGPLTIAKNLTITGLGSDRLTVSGNQKYQVFIVSTRITVTISGLSISNGYVKNLRGAGVYNQGKLTLDHVLINNNVLNAISLGGAGVFNSGTLIVQNSTIQNNKDTTYSLGGGGIYNTGTLTVLDSVITNNSVHSFQFLGVYGGGGICNLGTATINHSVITNNTATGFTSGGGGGIYNNKNLTISSSEIRDNKAVNTFGGGLLNYTKGIANVDHTVFSGNETAKDGGAIENIGTLTVTASTISGNQSKGTSNDYGGGGIDNTDGTATVINSTVSNNSSTTHGGGLLNFDGTLTLIFTTVSGNTASEGGGVATITNATEPSNTFTNTIIANSQGGDCLYESGTMSITNTLIADASCSSTFSGDPLLGPLQNNGGSTDTQLLLAGSPAIDQGVCNETLVDQRGLLRPVDDPAIPDWEGGGGCDLGAVEMQAQELNLPTGN